LDPSGAGEAHAPGGPSNPCRRSRKHIDGTLWGVSPVQRIEVQVHPPQPCGRGGHSLPQNIGHNILDVVADLALAREPAHAVEMIAEGDDCGFLD